MITQNIVASDTIGNVYILLEMIQQLTLIDPLDGSSFTLKWGRNNREEKENNVELWSCSLFSVIS